MKILIGSTTLAEVSSVVQINHSGLDTFKRSKQTRAHSAGAIEKMSKSGI